MVKAQSAIENTLSKGMSFMDLKDIIVAIINDPDIDLGYEYAPQEDDSVFRITEDDDLLKDLFYTIREESEEEYKSLPTSDEPGAEAEKVPLSLTQNSFIRSRLFSYMFSLHIGYIIICSHSCSLWQNAFIVSTNFFENS